MSRLSQSLARALPLSLLVLLACAPLAQAQNLVQDPGFESANAGGGYVVYFAPDTIGDGVWQVTAGAVVVQNNSALSALQSHSGSQFAYLTPNNSTNTLSQTLTTTPGTLYDLAFYAASDDTNNTFGVTFGGVPVPGIPTSLPDTSSGSGALQSSSYRQYTAMNLLATGSSTTLSFSASNPPGHIFLDDVSVVAVPAAVPEPGSIALLVGLGISGSVFVRRRKLARKAA